jgi:hypothetical protein
MRDKNKAGWLGLITLVGLFAPFLNAANALETKTLITTEKAVEAPKGVFLVSTAKTLEKYENSHSLTDEELVDLLKAVGFKGNALRSACAVAKAESNGRPSAFNPNKKDKGTKHKYYYKLGMKPVTEADPGATLGPGPKAGPKGVKNNYYVKNFGYKEVNPVKLAAKSKAIDTNYLWGKP